MGKKMAPLISGKLLLTNINSNCEEWLTIRSNTIGSSEIAVLLHQSPWQSVHDLYELKKTKNTTTSENDAMWWGKQLESIILQKFTLQTGIKHVQPFAIYADVTTDIATASPDAWLYDETMNQWGIGEVKNISAFKRHEWQETCPEQYRSQLIWQLGVTGLSWGYLIAKCDHELIFYKIYSSPEEFRRMLIIAKEFMFAVENNLPYTSKIKGTVTPSESEQSTVIFEGDNFIFKTYEELSVLKKGYEQKLKECEKQLKEIREDFITLAQNAERIVSKDTNWEVEIKEVIKKSYLVPSSSYKVVKIKLTK